MAADSTGGSDNRQDAPPPPSPFPTTEETNLTRSSGTYSRSPLESLIYDAVLLAGKAEAAKNDGYEESGALARASILSSATAIEATANCCLERGLDLPQGLEKPILYLRTMEKLDFFLYQLHLPPLDHGCIQVQRIDELINKVRNKYVHPLMIEQKAEILSTDSTTAIHPDYGDKTNFLKIPDYARLWKGPHAVVVANALLEFMDHFFMDRCGFDALRTLQLISDKLEVDVDGSARTYAATLYDAAYMANAAWGLRPRVFGLLFDEMAKRGVSFNSPRGPTQQKQS